MKSYKGENDTIEPQANPIANLFLNLLLLSILKNKINLLF